MLSTAFFLAFAFGLVVSVLGTAFMGPMVRVLGATDTCERYAVALSSPKYHLLLFHMILLYRKMKTCQLLLGPAFPGRYRHL